MSTTTRQETKIMFTLTDITTGASWNYDTEAQLKTVTRLYAASHPKSSISVIISGVTYEIRP
jgi:hypothetical protein